MENTIRYITAFIILTFFLLPTSVVFSEQGGFEVTQASLADAYLPNCNNEVSLLSEDVYVTLAKGMRNFEEKIDISSFGYVKTDIDSLNNDFFITLISNYDLYYVSSYYTYYYNSKGKITHVKPKYLITDIEEINATVDLIDKEINIILSSVDESMSEVQKLLTIYDKLCLQAVYDDTLSRHTAKDLLVDGTAVCQGYTSAFYCVAERLGCVGGFVRSQKMNHVWNAFLIDGKWYHADATWDDATHAGIVKHTYFLKSDQWMLNKGGHIGFAPIDATDTSYDNFFWVNSDSPVITIAGHMFFIDKSNTSGILSVYNSHTNETVRLYELTKLWTTDSGSYWNGTFSGLVYHKGRLYFNTEDSVLSCRLDGSDVKTEYTIEDETRSIYGCFEQNGKLYYEMGLKSNPSMELEQYGFEILPDVNNKFGIVGTFKDNDSQHASYINESGNSCKLIVLFKNGGQLPTIRVIPINNDQGTIELKIDSDSYEIMAINSNLIPLMEKYINK